MSVHPLEQDLITGSYNSSSPDEDPNIRWVVWHTNCMLFATLVLIPVGIFVSRYFKDTWTLTTFFEKPIWQLAHIAYMSFAFMIMFIGVILAIVYNTSLKRNNTTEEDTHKIIGWLALVMFGIQLVVGIWLPKADESYQKVFRIVHWLFGRITSCFLIVVAILSGMMNTAQFPYFSTVMILFWIIFAVAMHMGFAYFMHECDKEILSREEDGFQMYYRTFLPLPLPALENKRRKLRGANLRLILFLCFQFGTLAMCIPIFLSNSEGYGEYHCSVWEVIQFECSSFVPHVRY